MKLKLYDIGRADCVLLFDDQKHPSNQFMIDCGVKKKDTRNIVEINNDLSLKQKAVFKKNTDFTNMVL